MESKEQMIQRAASCLGIAASEVQAWVDKGLNLPENFDKASQSIEEFKCAVEQMNLPQRRKNSNYTKPRNRKKTKKQKR